MKVLSLLLFVSYGLAHQTHSEYHKFMSWAEAKAMESCWGEENNRAYLVSYKKAVAKCRQEDAPELDLPPYRSAYRFVNILTSSSHNVEQNKMEQVYDVMKFFHDQHHEEHYSFSHSSHQDTMEMMKTKFKMKQMMKNFMDVDSYAKLSHSTEEKVDSHHFDKSSLKGQEPRNRLHFGLKRPSRDAEESLKAIDLGDRLILKLDAQKESMVFEIGNMTCVLKEMKMINAENKIDVRGMKVKLNEYNLPSEWFKNRFEELIDNCFEMATNLRATIEEKSIVSGDFGEVNVGQIKTFLKCYKECHKKLCMNQDTKKKIEDDYGPLEEILEQTGWTEHQLFPAFVQLLSEDGMDYLDH